MRYHFQSIAADAQGLYRERGSKFLAFAFHITSGEEALQRVAEVRSIEPKARHHCFAYRLADQQTYRVSDDGEPSGTAGRPILAAIDAAGLVNVVVIVARHFGGKLLGASGLIRAYRTATAAALATASKQHYTVKRQCHIEFDYAVMGPMMSAISKASLHILDRDFALKPSITIGLDPVLQEEQLDLLLARALGRHPEEIAGERTFDQIACKLKDLVALPDM